MVPLIIRGPFAVRSSPFVTRALVVLGILCVEWFLIIGARLNPQLGLRAMLLPLAGVTAAVGYRRLRCEFQCLLAQHNGARFNLSYFVAHVLAIGLFIVASLPRWSSVVLSPGRLILADCAYGTAVLCLFCALLPPRALLRLAVSARVALTCGFAAAVLSWWIEKPLLSLWNQSAVSLAPVAFRSIAALLRLFLSHVDADPGNLRIGGDGFHVTISSGCSGVEGMSLIVILTSAWLWLFRSEIRFPRALLLVPATLLAMWASNIVRIVALILIGSSGAKEVAIGGFHSIAGWIAFNVVALAFCGLVCRTPWFLKERAAIHHDAPAGDMTGAYLMPFLAILAASFVTQAFSSGFDWFYPLRFIAAASALWYFRANYKTLPWRLSWTSPLLGLLVFAAWILLARLNGPTDGRVLGAGLASLSPPARFTWLGFRAVAAVSTVPFAEELAFRGFVARRLMAADFDRVSPASLSWTGIVGSSLIFGFMHGNQWLAGVLAGLVYAGAIRRSGRITDGIVAHATTNALLAAWVVWRGDWGLW